MANALRLSYAVPFLLPFLLGSANLESANQTVSPASQASQPELAAKPPSQTIDQLVRATPSAPVAAEKPVAPQADQSPAASPTPDQRQAGPQAASLRVAAELQPATDLPPIPIRVAIATDASTIEIATSSAGSILTHDGQTLGQLQANSSQLVLPTGQGLQVGDATGSTEVWIKPSQKDGLVYANGRWYRGPVQLIQQSDQVVAVNHTDLETYLYSVVGAEMPAYWPIDALKAQAIAARSYALVHMVRPASPHFDLGSTQRWQAYHGVNTETQSTHRAVNETRGMLLSYNGGIVESLYAASEGIVRDVHKGFGMSQEGANALAAEQQYSYQQILSHFYPGTQLALLNTKS